MNTATGQPKATRAVPTVHFLQRHLGRWTACGASIGPDGDDVATLERRRVTCPICRYLGKKETQ
jgi:hypothetical protein